MTLVVAHISPLASVIAADTVTWTADGGAVHLSKLRIIAAARTVIAVRGDHSIMTRCADAAERLRSFDEIADAVPMIAEAAYNGTPRRARMAPWEGYGYEMLIAGRSERSGYMRGVFLKQEADDLLCHAIPPSNSVLMPWSGMTLGPKPIDSLMQNHGIVAAMRRQAAWLRGLYPDVKIGGEIVMARISRFQMTVETLCSDL
jgi:hypothetical protein